MPFGGWSKPCNNECKDDHDCPADKKCCRLNSCATYCAEPIYIDETGAIPKPTDLIENTPRQETQRSTSLIVSPTLASVTPLPNVNSISEQKVQKQAEFNSNSFDSSTTNYCQDECMSDLDCHTSFSCTKIGCRHVCFVANADMKNSLVIRNEASFATSGLAEFITETGLIGGNSKVCRRQCFNQSDCSRGSTCVRFNCHFLCVHLDFYRV